MDTNKNLYTVIYATVLVVLVAAALAFASEALKPKQQRNIEIEKKQNILKSVNLGAEAATAKDKASYIEAEYAKYIKDTTIQNGEKALPLYICSLDSGEKVYIVRVDGLGLWGPIWGYVALKSDFNTIYGATFDHKGETPGLGADINTTWFGGQFTGKQIFKDGEFCSVEVVKGGADKSNPHQVDAISGGTITSKGLEKMLLDSFGDYLDFFKSRLVTASAPVATDSLSADSLKTATPDSSAVKQNIK